MGVAEPTSSGGTISRRFDWSFALLTIVAVAGAWLGRWAFLPGQPADSETIGAIVSTVALIGIGGLLAAVIVAEVRRGRSVRASVPPGYGLSIVGFGVLGLGVLLDVPSTMLFG